MGHRRVYVNRNVPNGIPRKQFYYHVTTVGGQTACRLFDVEICGHESITNQYNLQARTYPPSSWYDMAKVGPFDTDPGVP